MEHSGHRERLRARYAESGFEGFAPHEVLELLLTFAIPRVNVNPLAHRLLERFGWPAVGNMGAMVVPEGTDKPAVISAFLKELRETLPKTTAVSVLIGTNAPENSGLTPAVLAEFDGTGLLGHVASINVEKDYNIVVWYDDQYEIQLGGTEKLDYKVQYLLAILEQLSEYQAGTIDLTLTGDDVARFHPRA